jgi:hypothetical protein
MMPRASARYRPTVDLGARTIWQLYWWALVLRAGAGLAAYALTQYTEVPFFEDALYYEEMGYSVASDWLSGRAVDFTTLSRGAQTASLMVTAIAVFYYITQGVRALPLLLVLYSAVTAWVPVYIYRITREVGAPAAAARGAGWLVALSPAFVFWSGSLYKEGLVMLALGAGVYHALCLQSRWRGRSLAIVTAAMFALFALRFYLAIMMGVVIVLGLLWGRRDRKVGLRQPHALMPPLIRQAFIAAAFVGLMITLGFTENAERRLAESPEGTVVELDLSRLNVDRQWSATSAYSGYLTEADISTPTGAVRYFPVGLVYFLAVPFPWQFGSLRQNLVIPETAFWLLLYPLVGIGVVRALRVNQAGTMVLLAATGGMCVIYTLVSGNVGLAYRMRSQVWLLWAPLAAWGWEILRERRRARGGRAGESRRHPGSQRSVVR